MLRNAQKCASVRKTYVKHYKTNITIPIIINGAPCPFVHSVLVYTVGWIGQERIRKTYLHSKVVALFTSPARKHPYSSTNLIHFLLIVLTLFSFRLKFFLVAVKRKAVPRRADDERNEHLCRIFWER